MPLVPLFFRFPGILLKGVHGSSLPILLLDLLVGRFILSSKGFLPFPELGHLITSVFLVVLCLCLWCMLSRSRLHAEDVVLLNVIALEEEKRGPIDVPDETRQRITKASSAGRG